MKTSRRMPMTCETKESSFMMNMTLLSLEEHEHSVSETKEGLSFEKNLTNSWNNSNGGRSSTFWSKNMGGTLLVSLSNANFRSADVLEVLHFGRGFIVMIEKTMTCP
mmetsp:Transcript_6941/g.10840  ORF Transcript_6941/g.10840 Transcript_6941/m.10840 type:complete len:107 (+) Transcript_6941:706-1026(+)